MRIKTYAEMRSEGLCTKCGKPNPTPEHCMCPDCAQRHRDSKKRRREYMKMIGKCTQCGKNYAEPGKTQCLECAGKDSDNYYSKYRERKLKAGKAYKARKIEYCKSLGLCTSCGKYSSENGTLCKQCKGRLKRYRENNRKDIPRSERISYGICYTCGKNPILPGKGVCEECYGIRLTAINKCIKTREPGFNEYWKRNNKLIFEKHVLVDAH